MAEFKKEHASWLIKPPIHPCITGKGKCQLRHEAKDLGMDCEFKNNEWCKYRQL